MEKEEITELYHKYLDHSCTQQERKTFKSILLDPNFTDVLKEVLDGELLDMIELSDVPVKRSEEIFVGIVGPKTVPVSRTLFWKRAIAIAAVFAMVFSAGLWYAKYIGSEQEEMVFGGDAAPGRNGATLTLGDGRKILIDDALAGNLVEEAGVQISKDAEGNLVYKVLENNNERLTYHTLATTRGEQVRVRLPDGTLVFLNAGSSLRYPSSFAKLSKREVVLTGEGYFEVSKDRLHPFSVKTAKQQLEVLGTHFNVESYEEDRTRTTLVEGSVRVTESNGLTKELKPGQQSVLSAKGIQVEEVEAEYAVAWKDGFFMFNNDSLREIMEQVGLWYDVQVVYLDPSLQQETFIGTINKFEQLSKVLAMLEKTKVATFKVEGKRIIISRR